MNSLSSRYNGDRFSTQYGYRIIEIDENDTSVYETRAVHWYEVFDAEYAFNEMKRMTNKTAMKIKNKMPSFENGLTGAQVPLEQSSSI
jgi:hypothetical protein